MKLSTKLAVATFTTAFIAPMALAQNDPISNPMTNIATFVPGCEMATVGVDFGANAAGVIASAIISTTGNTTAGNLITGNAAHPDAKADDGESVGATTGIGPVDTIVDAALAAVNFDVAGVYIVCTSPAVNVVIDGKGTDLTVDLSASSTLTNDTTFTSTLDPSVTDASGATSSLNYGLGFTGPVVVANTGLPGVPAVTTALLVAMGTISAAQTATSGYYTDVVAVTLNY